MAQFVTCFMDFTDRDPEPYLDTAADLDDLLCVISEEGHPIQRGNVHPAAINPNGDLDFDNPADWLRLKEYIVRSFKAQPGYLAPQIMIETSNGEGLWTIKSLTADPFSEE